MYEIINMDLVVLVVLVLLVGKLMRDNAVNTYKIAYYEQKLKNRDVDISHIENITLTAIIKG